MDKKGEKSKYRPLETYEQQKLITWVDTFHMDKSQYLFAIPNGGSRHPAEAVRLKAEGVRPGVLDLFFYQPRGGYHGLFIEMKRRRGSTSVVSGGQRGFIDRARKQGYFCAVCWGFDEARAALETYWGLPMASSPPEVTFDDSDGLLSL